MNNVSVNPLFLAPPPSALVPATKRCARCTEQKPWCDFNHRRDTKDGKQSYCRHCQDDDRLQRFYHCSSQERALLYERQRGQCAVCQGAHPQLYIYAVEGLGVLSLVCPRCTRVLNGLNRNPAIVESAIDYLDYFRERVLYGVALCYKEDWEPRPTGEPQGKMRRAGANAGHRSSRRRVNEETYEHWSLLTRHTCYICGEACPTGRDLAVDHQHATERNRGLLCLRCNTTLGMAKEDTALLQACAAFLTSYLVPYIARCVAITDAMVADAAEAAPWVSRASSHVLSASQLL